MNECYVHGRRRHACTVSTTVVAAAIGLAASSAPAGDCDRLSLFPTTDHPAIPLDGNLGGADVGDLNEDGLDDLVVASIASDGVWVLLATPDGGFADPVLLECNENAADVAVSDLDGDGHLDFFTVSRSTNWVCMRFGTGDGGFGPPELRWVSETSHEVVAADLDEDGIDEVVVLLSEASQLKAYDITAGGGMTTIWTGIVNDDHRSLVVADFDGDGHEDIVTRPSGGDTILVRPGVGDGSFGFPSTVFADDGLWMAAGDLDGDGDDDLVTGDTSGPVRVLLADGRGGFGPPVAVPDTTDSDGVGLGDFDGDGTLDLIRNTSDAVEIRLGLGDGDFASAAPTSAVAAIWTLPVDVDHDGNLDLVYLSDPEVFGMRASVRWHLGDGAGDLAGLPRVLVDGQLDDLVAFDANEDGAIDLVGVDRGSDRLVAMAGDGTGAFSIVGDIPTTQSPSAAAAGDLTGDGVTDLVVMEDTDRILRIYVGDGTGGFAPGPELTFGPADVFNAVAVADLDGNGRDDVLTAGNASGDGAGRLVAWMQGSDGLGDPLSSFGITSLSVSGLALADFDGDGVLDAAASNRFGNGLDVALGDGDGGFALHTQRNVGSFLLDVDSADLDGDGDADLVIVDRGDEQLLLLPGDGTGGFGPDEPYFVGGDPSGVAIADFDGDGRLDLAPAREGNATLCVLFGQTDGSFGDTSFFAVDTAFGSLVAVDVDGDAAADLVGATPVFTSGSVLPLVNQCTAPCIADIDGSGDVGLGDVIAVLAFWGPCPICIADVNGDSVVDFFDLLTVISTWGPCPE